MRPPDLCTGLTKAGEACGFSARRESGLCINHDPTYRERQAENTRRGLEAAHAATRKELRARVREPGFSQFNLTTRERVQACLDGVIRLEMEGRIPLARSRNIIRACSLAMRNFNPPKHVGVQRYESRHDLERYQEARMWFDWWVGRMEEDGVLGRRKGE